MTFVAFLVGAGCSSPSGGNGSGVDASAVVDTSVDSGIPNQGGLKIVSFASTVSRLTDMQQVQFIAVVTDALGIDAIAGGTLTDETGATYGGFSAGAQKGAYSVTLDWAMVNQVRTLDFVSPGQTRTFTANFFDNAGATASASVQVTFYCGANSELGACGGMGRLRALVVLAVSPA
jgi:hypothetical protein